MSQFLLGPNTLIDLCYDMTSSDSWLATVKITGLYTSVIAVAAARATITVNAKSSVARSRVQNTLNQVVARLQNGGMTVLPFGESEAQAWEDWRDLAPLEAEVDGQRFEVGQDTRMIIATAAANGLELVEPYELYHDELRRLGQPVTSL